jgi:rhamnosyltransferase
MPLKIAACIIFYNPFLENISNHKSYINVFEKVYIVDNSEKGFQDFSEAFPTNTKIISDGCNNGIAKRLNQVCNVAANEGFDFLLTMDQDSFFDESTITKYIECIDSTENKSAISMFGINYENKTNSDNCTCNETKMIITSGSIINLRSFQKIGGFDENLFIDLVDTEYCFRSIKKGFKIIEFSHIYMHHHLGTGIEKYSLKTLKKTKRSFHTATRLYYMTRNFLYLQSLYKNDFKNELSILKKDLINRIKNKLLYAPGRLKTIKLLLKGIHDYRKNRMGKLPD